MSSKLTKIRRLLHNWFPNKEDDKRNFEEWYSSSVHIENGGFIIGVLTPQNKTSVTVSRMCRNIGGQQFGGSVFISKSSLLPSPSNANQPLTVQVGSNAISPNSSNEYVLVSNVSNSGCPSTSSFVVTVTFEEYSENNVIYNGIKYKFTVPSFNATNQQGIQRMTYNVEIIS